MLTPLWKLLFATNAVPHTTVQENPRELNATGVGRTLLPLTGDSVENVRLFQISILGYDSILDPDRRVVSIEWVISECRDQKLTTQNPRATFGGSPPCSPPNRTIDVYLNKWVCICLCTSVSNNRVSSASDKIFSYNPKNLPVDPDWGPIPYAHNLRAFRRSVELIADSRRIRELVSFRAEHGLNPSKDSADSFFLRAFVSAIDPATNSPIEISQFAVLDFPDGFTISSRDTNAASVSDRGATTVGIKSRALEVEFRRSKPLETWRAYVLPVSWALTLVSLYIELVLPIVGMRSVLRLVGGRFAQIWVIDTPGHYSIVSRSVSLDSMKIFSQIVRGILFHCVVVYHSKSSPLHSSAVSASRKGLTSNSTRSFGTINQVELVYS